MENSVDICERILNYMNKHNITTAELEGKYDLFRLDDKLKKGWLHIDDFFTITKRLKLPPEMFFSPVYKATNFEIEGYKRRIDELIVWGRDKDTIIQLQEANYEIMKRKLNDLQEELKINTKAKK